MDPEIDLSLAALFAGWALADEVQRRIAADDETSGSSAPSRRPAQESKPAAPNVREEADEGGRVKNRVERARRPSGIEKFFNFLRGGNKEKKEKQRAPSSPSSPRR